jgi:hypothetical protein
MNKEEENMNVFVIIGSTYLKFYVQIKNLIIYKEGELG